MEMKKLISIGFIILCPLFSNSYAAPLDDICSKIPGHWQGIFTVKDPEACKIYNGCTHLVMADVTYIANDEYHLNLNPAVGVGGEFNMKCNNGEITTPNPDSKVSVSCNASNQCYVFYDDSRLTSEMMKN